MLLNVWCVYAQQRYLRKKENFWVSWSMKHHNLAVRELNMSTLHIPICKFDSWWKVSLDYQLNLYQQRMQSRNAWFLFFYLFTPKIEMWKMKWRTVSSVSTENTPVDFSLKGKRISQLQNHNLVFQNLTTSFLSVYFSFCVTVNITFVKNLVIIVESHRKSNNRMCLCNI